MWTHKAWWYWGVVKTDRWLNSSTTVSNLKICWIRGTNNRKYIEAAIIDLRYMMKRLDSMELLIPDSYRWNSLERFEFSVPEGLLCNHWITYLEFGIHPEEWDTVIQK